MPKTSSSTSRVNGEHPFQTAHVLRRNQACHQCRRRKLKCDAKRPCSTCVRSHSYAVAHAPAGAELPPHPHCTFDEVSDSDNGTDAFENPKARFERLENRITELEALLQEKDKALAPRSSDDRTSSAEIQLEDNHASRAQLSGSGSFPDNYESTLHNAIVQQGQMQALDPIFSLPEFQTGSALDNLAGVASLIGTPGPSRMTSDSPIPIVGPSILPTSPAVDHSMGLMYNAWPRSLPNPDFLRHLVDAFFSCHPDATHMFHQSTFLSSLLLPPTHPKFPDTSLLHALCAVGSMYTAAVPTPSTPTAPDISPYDVFPDKHKSREGNCDSFGEMHIRYARASLDATVNVGIEFQNVQAFTLISWWYWANAKWADAFLSTSHTLRYAVPCGLNICPPFHAISETLRPLALLQPASTIAEDEMRRNSFWIAYCLERCHGTGNGWAMVLDDQDVSQLLPVRRDEFEQGTLVLLQDRQWSHDKDALTRHPEDRVDGFVLYIKSILILSRVKNFNLRYRSRYYAGDVSTRTFEDNLAFPHHLVPGSEFIDPRRSVAFIELDQLVTSFKSSFPLHLRNPVKEHIDPHLFAACTVAQFADILLHEPHAIVGQDSCSSSVRILAAARAILDLLYQVSSSSYNLSLLGLFPIMCWFMSGRVLVRFLRSAIDCNSEELCLTLWAEVDYIREVIFRVGEHIPFAHRYGKMLHDFLVRHCGECYAGAPPVATGMQTGDATLPQTTMYSSGLQAIPTPPL